MSLQGKMHKWVRMTKFSQFKKKDYQKCFVSTVRGPIIQLTTAVYWKGRANFAKINLKKAPQHAVQQENSGWKMCMEKSTFFNKIAKNHE